ncbi:hypothetical protein C8R46DRAFT_1207501 [Mycena filopes]|nr:hypothetical protein C8R46DRAFT_1207501 [Mycena filopes]
MASIALMQGAVLVVSALVTGYPTRTRDNLLIPREPIMSPSRNAVEDHTTTTTLRRIL